MNMINMSTTEQ